MSLPPVGSLFAIDNRRYEAQLEKDWQYILVDSDAKVLVVATEAIYEKVKNYPGKVSWESRLGLLIVSVLVVCGRQFLMRDTMFGMWLLTTIFVLAHTNRWARLRV